jgi:hypothetical protein
MMQGWRAIGLLALAAAITLPANATAQAQDPSAAARDRQIAELKAKIDEMLSDVELFQERVVDPEAKPAMAEARGQIKELKARLSQLMKERAGAEFAGYAQEAEKEVAQARLKELQAQLAQQADRAKGETDSLEAQLKRIEAARQQKAAEVRELEARIREMTAKMKAGQPGQPARQPAGQPHYQPLEWRFDFAPGQAEPAEEITLRKVNGKWEVVNPRAKQPDQPRRVILTPDGAEAGGKRIMLNPIEIQTTPPNRPASSNSRIDELEKKIDKALQQLEQMRREMNRGRPGAALTPQGAIDLGVIIDGDVELQNLVEPAPGRPGANRK